jgi:hypothetical protein
MKVLFALALMAYPVWLGAHHRSLGLVAVFVLIFAATLFISGPKSQDVQDNPSKPTMALFALVLSAGLTGVGYFLGHLIFG